MTVLKSSLIFTALLCGAQLLAGKDAKLLDNGTLELDGWRGTLATYTREWHTLTPAASPAIFRAAVPPAKRPVAVKDLRYRLELPNGGSGNLVLSLKNGSGFQGSMNLEHGSLIRYLCLQAPLSISQYSGTQFEVNGKLHTFPTEYKTETIFDGVVKQLRLPTRTGEIQLEGKFYLRIQDGRKWQGATYGMRIGFLPHQGVDKIRNAKLDFQIRYGKSGEFGPELGSIVRPPYVAKAGKEWKAFPYHRDVLPGSALDFSARLDAPAGKYGPVIAGPDGQFVFRDRPQTPVRFYGPNFVGDSQLPDKKTAGIIAERFAAFGFNVVRFHHHDNEVFDHSCREPSRLVPERMDRLDYLIACLKKRGIYYSTDVYVSRRNIPASEFGDLGAIQDIREYKALFYIDDRVYADWERWAERFLGHVNPYTGLALKDDPALISLSLVNEANPAHCWGASPRAAKLYRQKFEEWKKSNPGKTFDQFLSYLAVKRFNEMKRSLRKLGCSALLTDQNFLNRLYLAADRQHYDFVDNHAYWDHPRFAENRWQLPVLPSQGNPVGARPGVPGWTLPTRLFGKGFTVSEFDYANPNIYRAAGPAMMAAYAAFQNWDALFPFAYAHSQASVVNPDRTSGFFDIATDPVKTFSQRIGARLFLAGGIEPAENAFAALVTEPFRKGATAEAPHPFSDLGLLARIGLVTKQPAEGAYPALIDVGTGRTDGKTPVFRATERLIPDLISAGLLPENCYDAATGRFSSSDGQLELNRRRQTLRVTAPGGEVLITGKDRKLAGRSFRVENRDDFAVFALLPVDTERIATARRLTLMHLTNTQATGMRFGNDKFDRLEEWGKTPFLARHGSARLTFNLPGEWEVHALNTAGKRLAKLPQTRQANGDLVLELDNFRYPEAVFAYELIRTK